MGAIDTIIAIVLLSSASVSLDECAAQPVDELRGLEPGGTPQDWVAGLLIESLVELGHDVVIDTIEADWIFLGYGEHASGWLKTERAV